MAEKSPRTNPFSCLSSTVVEETLVRNPFEKISGIVATELESAIIAAKFQPGQRLNISQIADAMCVSPTPVWEAIERLQEIGLVVAEPIPNSRRNVYRVFEMTPAEIEDFFLTRAALESLAAQICATKTWNVDMPRLKEYAVKFREGLYVFATDENAKSDPVNFSEVDRTFHTMLIKATRNHFLIESYNALDRISSFLSIKTSYYMGLQLNRDDALTLGNQHMTIYNAIENGYAELARNLKISHIKFCAEHTLRNLSLDSRN